MSCQETEVLIHGYLDNELDLSHSLRIEEHLRDCASCAQALQQQMQLQQAIRTLATRYRAPMALRDRLEKRGRSPWYAVMAAAAAVVVSIGLWTLPHRANGPEQELAEAHIRSLMANHLTDVISTDQHTVKPWFTGKLDFSPPVHDYADRGFSLIGGRLDYIDGKPSAAVVYKRRQHVINLFVSPAAGDRSQKSETSRGYNVVTWARGGMSYSLVSDLNRKELEELAALLQQ